MWLILQIAWARKGNRNLRWDFKKNLGYNGICTFKCASLQVYSKY